VTSLNLSGVTQSSRRRSLRSRLISGRPIIQLPSHDCFGVLKRPDDAATIITGDLLVVELGKVQPIAAAGGARQFNSSFGQEFTV
jgi:hypothetical protein